MSTETPAALSICAGCQRALEWCAFYDEDGCSVALCYECLVVELRQTKPQPHLHGG
jgi:hypothetical protein